MFSPSHVGRLLHSPDASHSRVPDETEAEYPESQDIVKAVSSGLSTVGLTEAALVIVLAARLAARQVSTAAAS